MEERLLEILRLALRYGATDIHFMYRLNTLEMDMRINGENKKLQSKPHDERLLKYLQYLARLDMGKVLKPQTGQFEMEIDGTLLSLRFAIINAMNYSDGVLRVLNSNIKINANQLSSIQEQNEYFLNLLHRDCGLIIFSGPTGSGKTTTLYSLLNSIPYKKIYTIEDPIEVYNDAFVQMEINNAAGFDYETSIKQVLRHDPDIVMIGEIRDHKAAKAALDAANTGHLVLTTIHASKASSIISRMVELGVNESHLYENLLCLCNQRMKIDQNDQKLVLYEIMDEKEIEYFKEHQENSPAFYSLEKQIENGKNKNLFKDI